MTNEPKIRDEVRIERLRTSISVPQDVDAWVRWYANEKGMSISSVYATAIKQLASASAPESVTHVSGD